MSSLNYGEFCRLCLVKESVSIPIFEGEGDVRRLCLKITTCLPVKVSREDRLPKRICDDCLYKLENQYSFWNSTANAEKQLLQWYELDSLQDEKKIVPTTNLETEQLDLKQEIVDPEQGSELAKSLSRVEAVLAEEAGRQAAEEEEEEEESEEEGSNSEESEEEEDNDNDADEPSKEDNESEENYEELEPTTFVNVSLACDEAGPSGMQQQQQQQQQTSVPSSSTPGPAASGVQTNLKHPNLLYVQYPLVVYWPGKPSVTDLQHGVEQSRIYSRPCIAGNMALENSLTSQSSEIDTKLNLSKDVYTSVGRNKLVHPQVSDGKDNVVRCTNVSIFHKTPPPTRQLKCEICNKTCTSAARLKVHLMSHSDKRPFPCELCGKGFKSKAQVKKHMSTHTGERRFKCDVCDYSTNDNTQLRFHKNKRHDKIRNFVCETCGKSYACSSGLKDHLEVHQEKKFKCNQCNKAFHSRNNLAVHEQIHNPNRLRFPCEICGKNYSMPRSVRNHIKHAHLGEKKKLFKCEYCDKVITSLSSLRIHRRTHTGDKPFSCDTCEKSFSSKNLLIMHIRVHTGEKPFTCNLCEKSFTQRGTLTIHKRLHTGLRPYECDKCSKSFVTGTLLRTHMKSHA